MRGNMVGIQSSAAENRRRKKEERNKKKEIRRNHESKIECPHLPRRAAVTRSSWDSAYLRQGTSYQCRDTDSASGERRGCSNEAKTRNPLKFAGAPQTNETISAASAPKFAIL